MPADPTPTAWVTQPTWTRAHALVHVGTSGAEQIYGTACELDYRLDDPINDEPTAAPDDMPHCRNCVRQTAEET